MAIELLIRFLIGGAIVSAYAVIGDMLRPKTFAGIFGAAPSVALATLGMTFMKQGGAYAAIEGRSMIVGAIAFFVYNLILCPLLMKRKCKAWVGASAAWAAWLVVAFGLGSILGVLR